MSFNILMSHFKELNSEMVGATKYVLGAYAWDVTASSRVVLVDVSHQSRTQANYLSSLTQLMNKWQCRNLVIYLNAATQTLVPSFNADFWCLVDAGASPVMINEYQLFPLINQDPEQLHYEGALCYSPSHGRCLTEADV